MTKQLKGFIGTLFLGVVLLLGAVTTIISDTDRDLDKTNQIMGTVSSGPSGSSLPSLSVGRPRFIESQI